jgi:hypothetical protein
MLCLHEHVILRHSDRLGEGERERQECRWEKKATHLAPAVVLDAGLSFHISDFSGKRFSEMCAPKA